MDADQPEGEPIMGEEKKRTVLTPAQRVAKAEAELKALREKAEAKAQEQGTKLRERREALVKRRDEAQSKIDDIDAELDSLGLEPVKDSEPADEQPELPVEDEQS